MTRPLRLALLLAPLALAACSTSLVCPQGQVDCGGSCVDLAVDAAHCGACATSCGPLSVCTAGSCGCVAGASDCAGACVDLLTDGANCGACGAACTGGASFCATTGSPATTACVSSCPGGLAGCGSSCVDLLSDRADCGACGAACAAGQTCRSGACVSEIEVACYATDTVQPVDAALAAAGPARLLGGSPQALAVVDSSVWASVSYPAGVASIPLDARVPSSVDPFDLVPYDSDVEALQASDQLLLASDDSAQTLVVFDPATAAVLDSIPLAATPAAQAAGLFPHGVDVLGGRAFVALYGESPSSGGQAIAVVDLSLDACAVPDPTAPTCSSGGACPTGRGCIGGVCRIPCGAFEKQIPVLGVPGAASSGALPFPGAVKAAGSRVYVTLANLQLASTGGFTGYIQPAGSGRLAVIDTANGDALSILDLGTACENPGALALDGTTLWVACGSFSYPAQAPGTLLPIDVSSAPVIGAPLAATSIVPGSLAFCGGKGYVTDQASGAVLPFDPLARTVGAPVTVCPTGTYGWAWASDLACAF